MTRISIVPLIAAMVAAAPLRAQDPVPAVFSDPGGKVLFWQTNRLAGGQGTCTVRLGFDGATLAQPIDDLTLAVRVLHKNGTDLGIANLVLVDPLGGAGAARYREALFEGVSRWPLQDDGALSPLCDEGTTLVVESAMGRQSGKAIDLVRFGQLEFTSFPRIRVKVGK
jgi:hypothetical protein